MFTRRPTQPFMGFEGEVPPSIERLPWGDPVSQYIRAHVDYRPLLERYHQARTSWLKMDGPDGTEIPSEKTRRLVTAALVTELAQSEFSETPEAWERLAQDVEVLEEFAACYEDPASVA